MQITKQGPETERQKTGTLDNMMNWERKRGNRFINTKKGRLTRDR